MLFYEKNDKPPVCHCETGFSRSWQSKILKMIAPFTFLRSPRLAEALLAMTIILMGLSIRAQTAQEMSKELENLYRKGEGTTISFLLDDAKNSLTFSNTVSNFRIESPDDLIVSDGTTIWHLSKKKKEVVIDKISSKGTSLATAEELLKFSTNYSSVLSHKKNTYELSLAPSANISKLMESIGGISLLTFTFTKGHSIEVKKISAKTANKNYQVSNIKIKSLAKLDNKLFTFNAPKGVKVIDLRE